MKDEVINQSTENKQFNSRWVVYSVVTLQRYLLRKVILNLKYLTKNENQFPM